MADERLYITNITLGLACKLYSRLGDGYAIDDPDGFKELVDRVRNELCIDDDFQIIDEAQLLERIPESQLWKIKPEYVKPPIALKSELDFYKNLYDNIRAERIYLHNECVSLGRRLKDAEDRLANKP